MGRNSKTLKVMKGVRSHTPEESQGDYYATPPSAIPPLLEGLERNGIRVGPKILEPCCGEGSISKTLKSLGYKVFSYDKVNRGYGKVQDFLKRDRPFDGTILTNPPYYDGLPIAMIRKGISLIPEGQYVIFLVKLSFLSGKNRAELFREYPPRLVLVYSHRVGCALNGDFSVKIPKGMDYCWIVFQKGYTGPTTLDWIGGKK